LNVVRDQRIEVTFRSDDETAYAIKDAMRVAAIAMIDEATEDDVSALFHLAAERIITSA
jgi:hypothetical protein